MDKKHKNTNEKNVFHLSLIIKNNFYKLLGLPSSSLEEQKYEQDILLFGDNLNILYPIFYSPFGRFEHGFVGFLHGCTLIPY